MNTSSRSAFHKVRFSSKEHGATAGVILSSRFIERNTVSEISRLFPYSESMKMETFEVSPAYETADAAFYHSFDGAA